MWLSADIFFLSPQIIIFMDAFSAVTIMASASRQMVHPAASIVLRPPPWEITS